MTVTILGMHSGMSREFHLINTGKIRKLFRQILNIRKKTRKYL